MKQTNISNLTNEQLYELAEKVAEIFVESNGINNFLYIVKNKSLRRIYQEFKNEPFSTDDLRSTGLVNVWNTVRKNPRLKNCWEEVPKNKRKKSESKYLSVAKTWRLTVAK